MGTICCGVKGGSSTPQDPLLTGLEKSYKDYVTAGKPLATVGPVAPVGTAADGWMGGALAPNGIIYGMPYAAQTILKIDTATDAYTASAMGATLTGANKYKGAVLANGKIYGISYLSAQGVLKIDPVANTATVTTMGVGGANDKWQGGVLGKNGLIYTSPSSSVDILVIDPKNDTTRRTAMGLSSTVMSQVNKFTPLTLLPDGRAVAWPMKTGLGAGLLVIDTNDDTASFETFGKNWAQTNPPYEPQFGMIDTVLGPDGNVYAFSARGSSGGKTIMMFDPVREIVSELAMGTDGSSSQMPDLGEAAVGGDGLIYARTASQASSVPSSAMAIDVFNQTMRPIGTTTLQCSGLNTGPNGKIYGIQAGTNPTFIIDTAVNTAPFAIDPMWNRY